MNKFSIRMLLKLACCAAVAVGASPALAGGSIGVPSPSITISPGAPVLDPRCVDQIKSQNAAVAARAAHECRHPRNPGTPEPLTLAHAPAVPTVPDPSASTAAALHGSP